MGWLWRGGQAAAGASPVTWFQVVNLVVISCRYWAAVSRESGKNWGRQIVGWCNVERGSVPEGGV
jgi:hypothetical protein